MNNEISKVKQVIELKNKPITKRANMIDFAENINVLALELPLIWRSLAMKTSTRDEFSISEGKEISGLTYPDFRDNVKSKLTPAFYIESLNWTGDKIPYYVVLETIEIFKEMRNKMFDKLKDNF